MAIDVALRVRSAIGVSDRPGGKLVRDVEALAPAFQSPVVTIVERMKAGGFDPLIWETYRSPERAAMLAKKGSGIALSMHCYGCAVDIISESKKWNAGFAFWRRLRDEAESLDLVSGARFSRRDKPHIQCVPIASQGYVRSLHRQRGQQAVNAWVAEILTRDPVA
jgi:hypothetical protein